jgi:ParB family chromosome partitioning protein
VAASGGPSRGLGRGLGRGLSALIPETPAEPISGLEGKALEVPIGQIKANPQQPRQEFEPAALAELAQSVREHGVLQPLLVTELPREAGVAFPEYQLIAGERRLRAAEAAGLETVPVTVREGVPRDQLELALIENVQREDLNPLEEARAYKRLIDDFGLTQQQVAERVGRSRTAVTNRLRLFELPPQALEALVEGTISEGHARALLPLATLDERLEALERVRRDGLSVRQTERLVQGMRGLGPGRAAGTSQRRASVPDPELEAVTEALRRELGTRVALRRSARGRGTLTVHFHSDEELDGLLERLLPADALS